MKSEIQKVYYDRNGIIVRPTLADDILYLKDNLRPSDVQEIWASHHFQPHNALYAGFRDSVLCLSIINRGLPIGIFGLNSEHLFSNSAIIWFLSTPHLYRIKIRFLRHCDYFIDLMLGMYPYLYNWVDARNVESIEWLKFCGATIEDPQPFGQDMLPFHYFYFEA